MTKRDTKKKSIVNFKEKSGTKRKCLGSTHLREDVSVKEEEVHNKNYELWCLFDAFFQLVRIVNPTLLIFCY